MLRITHGALVTSATICSIIVAAKINSFDKTLIEWLSAGAAMSVALLSAFDLGLQANKMRRAWRKLNASVIRYQEGVIEVPDLINAYEEAEGLIGDIKEKPDQ